MTIELTAHVRRKVEPPGGAAPTLWDSFAVRWSCGGTGPCYTVPKGYPPIGFYYLSASPTQHSKILARGAATIRYERRIRADGRYLFPRNYSIVGVDERNGSRSSSGKIERVDELRNESAISYRGAK